MGGLALSTLLGKLFDEATGDIDAFEFRYSNANNTQTLELHGTDAEFQEVASFTQPFTDLENFKTTASLIWKLNAKMLRTVRTPQDYQT